MDRLCRTESARDHDIVARHVNAMDSRGLDSLQHTVINTALVFAIKDVQSHHAQHWLVAGADANLVLRHNFGILHLAIHHGSRLCHSLLLEHGANPNFCAQHTRPSTEIDPHAIDHRMLRDVPLGIVPHSPLAYAIQLDRQEIAGDLLQAGADMNEIARNDLPEALASEIDDVLQYVPKIESPYSPLAYAIKLERRLIVRYLLQAGASIHDIIRKHRLTAMEGDIDDFPRDMAQVRKLRLPLAYAIKLDRGEIARDLLQAGAYVRDIKEEHLSNAIESEEDNTPNSMPPVRKFGSPLTYAIILGRWEIAQDLLHAGADVNDIEEENLPTAMEGAVEREDVYLIYLLSFRGYYETHEEPVVDDHPSLRDAFTISQAHFDQSSTWPHLHHQGRLSRQDFMALWTILQEFDADNMF